MMMESPPQGMGYWPEGIGNAAPGNGHMLDSQEIQWRGHIDVLREEHGDLMRSLIEAEVPLIVVPYPSPELFDQPGITQDIEFMRDPSLGAQRGEALILQMGAPSRRGEAEVTGIIYDALGVPHRTAHRGIHEGGNTKEIQIGDETWYFSGTSKRSGRDGLEEASEFLGNSEEGVRHVLLAVDNGLHVDCISTGAVSPEGQVILSSWMDGFTPDSQRAIEQAARDLDADLYELDKKDAEELNSNRIQWGDHLFTTGRFNNRAAREAIDNSGLQIHVTPLSQNLRLGGGIHCLTKEVFMHTPVDAAMATAHLTESGLFIPGGEVKIYNNY